MQTEHVARRTLLAQHAHVEVDRGPAASFFSETGASSALIHSESCAPKSCFARAVESIAHGMPARAVTTVAEREQRLVGLVGMLQRDDAAAPRRFAFITFVKMSPSPPQLRRSTRRRAVRRRRLRLGIRLHVRRRASGTPRTMSAIDPSSFASPEVVPAAIVVANREADERDLARDRPPSEQNSGTRSVPSSTAHLRVRDRNDRIAARARRERNLELLRVAVVPAGESPSASRRFARKSAHSSAFDVPARRPFAHVIASQRRRASVARARRASKRPRLTRLLELACATGATRTRTGTGGREAGS
jgi:hypothetical protein